MKKITANNCKIHAIFFSSFFKRVRCYFASIFLLCQHWQIKMEKIWNNKTDSWSCSWKELWVVRLKSHLENNRKKPSFLFSFPPSRLCLFVLYSWKAVARSVSSTVILHWTRMMKRKTALWSESTFETELSPHCFPQSEFCQYPGSKCVYYSSQASLFGLITKLAFLWRAQEGVSYLWPVSIKWDFSSIFPFAWI